MAALAGDVSDDGVFGFFYGVAIGLLLLDRASAQKLSGSAGFRPQCRQSRRCASDRVLGVCYGIAIGLLLLSIVLRRQVQR